MPDQGPRLVIGWREWVCLPDLLPDPGDALNAKIDTGARTSALHAWEIDYFDRGGQTWAGFSLHPHQHNDEHVVTAEAKVVDERDVRSSNGELETRPIITTTLSLGGDSFPIELSLTNRDQMGMRMLIGRIAIADHALVDPGRSYLLGGSRRHPGR